MIDRTYDEGYRAGAMAERRRVILLALQARKAGNFPSDEGYVLAHKISEAGDYLPTPIEEHLDPPEHWSVFGERRLVRERCPDYIIGAAELQPTGREESLPFSPTIRTGVDQFLKALDSVSRVRRRESQIRLGQDEIDGNRGALSAWTVLRCELDQPLIAP